MSYCTNDFSEFQTVLDILWNYSQYKYVYISIGGKINEYEFNIQHCNKSIKMISNAHHQMIPSFLCDRNSKILIICIDHFQNESDEKINRDVCKSLIQPNMDFIFYDHHITLSTITDFFKYFDAVLETRRIFPEHFMVCNYIRFLNDPNMDEVLLDDRLSEVLVHTMSAKYKRSVFQWFGYHPNLYNIIFNYQDYSIMNLSRFSQLSHFLEKTYGVSQLSSSYASNMKKHFETFPFLEKFMKHTIDIHSYYHGEKIADPLIEWI
jgi:hypothetical protein